MDDNNLSDSYDILCKIIPSYDYYAEGVAIYLNKYPIGCTVLSCCEQCIDSSVITDGIIFGYNDRLTFIGFGRTNHSFYETTHFINIVSEITINKKKLNITDCEQLFTYSFTKNIDILKHVSDFMSTDLNCIKIDNNHFRSKKTSL